MTWLVFDPSARRLANGRMLLGGRPARMLRFTPAGARLVDAGLAHPRPESGAVALRDVAVVIPVRDRADALAACLERVGMCGELVIVDDASTDPVAIAAAVTQGLEGAVGDRSPRIVR